MFNKLACINANVSIDLSKISNGSVKKSYKNKIKSKLFRFNSLKNKSNNLVSSTFVSQSKSPIIKYKDEFSDYSDDSDSDISFTSLNDDLNSSLSSVSSLEFEPFECPNERKLVQQSSIKKTIVRKPILHSSRSSFAQVASSQQVFEPRITSSRKSLLQPNNFKPECSVCYESKISTQNGSGYFSFSEEQNICSSTHISVDFMKQNSTKNLSESVFTNSSVYSNSQFSDFSS